MSRNEAGAQATREPYHLTGVKLKTLEVLELEWLEPSILARASRGEL